MATLCTISLPKTTINFTYSKDLFWCSFMGHHCRSSPSRYGVHCGLQCSSHYDVLHVHIPLLQSSPPLFHRQSAPFHTLFIPFPIISVTTLRSFKSSSSLLPCFISNVLLPKYSSFLFSYNVRIPSLWSSGCLISIILLSRSSFLL